MLVVTDVQNGFVREQSAHIVSIIVALVQDWQRSGGDILFTRYINYPDSPFERFFGWRRMQSPPETEVVPELKPFLSYGTVIDKTIYSPFTDKGAKLVEERGWTDLYFCGIATESRVLKGAVDAFERNLTPWLIADASASHAGEEAHAAGLLVARRFIDPGQVITRAQIPPTLTIGRYK
ncbi:cysteine hydrolase [Micromonospora chalcea]|uniref:cysteine hydrolase n=1 Tax=Micromonospora chalcea TaxID=1874 RepID=UPI003805C4EB